MQHGLRVMSPAYPSPLATLLFFCSRFPHQLPLDNTFCLHISDPSQHSIFPQRWLLSVSSCPQSETYLPGPPGPSAVSGLKTPEPTIRSSPAFSKHLLIPCDSGKVCPRFVSLMVGIAPNEKETVVSLFQFCNAPQGSLKFHLFFIA